MQYKARIIRKNRAIAHPAKTEIDENTQKKSTTWTGPSGRQWLDEKATELQPEYPFKKEEKKPSLFQRIFGE